MPSGDNINEIEPKEEANLYVYEKTVSIEENNINSVSRSIENERTKAGILFGFYFLILIEVYPLYSNINVFFQIIILLLVLIITYLLVDSFCSKKIDEGVVVNKNFDNNWIDKKKFLKYYFEIINNNKVKQKKLLSHLSKNIKNSAILLSLIVLIIFSFNINKNMTNEDNKNPMKPDCQELGEDVREVNNTSSTPDQNTMTNDVIEKGAGTK